MTKFMLKMISMMFFICIYQEIDSIFIFLDIQSEAVKSIIRFSLTLQLLLGMFDMFHMLINGEYLNKKDDKIDIEKPIKEEKEINKEELSLVDSFNYTINQIKEIIEKERDIIDNNNLLEIINKKEKDLLKIKSYVLFLKENLIKIQDNKELGENTYYICNKNYKRIKHLIESEISYFNKLSAEYLSNSQKDIKSKLENSVNELVLSLEMEKKDAI